MSDEDDDAYGNHHRYYPAVRARLEDRGLSDLDIQRRGTKPKPGQPHRLTLGLR